MNISIINNKKKHSWVLYFVIELILYLLKNSENSLEFIQNSVKTIFSKLKSYSYTIYSRRYIAVHNYIPFMT